MTREQAIKGLVDALVRADDTLLRLEGFIGTLKERGIINRALRDFRAASKAEKKRPVRRKPAAKPGRKPK